jgi:hypothetical protein
VRREAPTEPKAEGQMSKLDDKIATYADALKTKAGVDPDMDLLRKVTSGLGPSIYNADAETVAATDQAEIDRIKQNFLIKKLGLSEADALDAGIASAIDTYGRADRSKYRAAIYYLLVKHFGKAGVYG